jgi:hypothetical protein
MRSATGLLYKNSVAEFASGQGGLRERHAKSATAPLIKGKGKLGPGFPKDENPHDLVFS